MNYFCYLMQILTKKGLFKLESKQESYKENNILNDEILDLLGQEEYENELTEILTKKDKHVEQLTKMRRCLDKVRIPEYTTTPLPPPTHRPMDTRKSYKATGIRNKEI